MNNSADLFKPKEPTPKTEKDKAKKSLVGTIKTIVFYPFYLIATVIFLRDLGK